MRCTKNDGLNFKEKDKRSHLINEADKKKDAKGDKSLALKVSQTEIPKRNENMAYFTQRFQKIGKKLWRSHEERKS